MAQPFVNELSISKLILKKTELTSRISGASDDDLIVILLTLNTVNEAIITHYQNDILDMALVATNSNPRFNHK